MKPTRLLRVTTEYFCAGAVWAKIYGVWICVQTAPILHWMKGKPAQAVKRELLRKHADYEWVD